MIGGEKMKIWDGFHLSILTWNLYMGVELPPLFTSTREKIPNLVSKVYRQFLATNLPIRVKAIAREIAGKKPDLIGLQEAVWWQLIIPNYRKVTYDFVQLLLIELKKRGLDYEVAIQNKNTSVELPDNNGNLVRLLDRDVILVRKGYRLTINKRMAKNFKTNLIVQIAGQQIEILRGWSSIDIQLEGQNIRMINTHLDTNSDIQMYQAKEILEGPANTNLPLIVTGDLNSNAHNYDTPTYKRFIDVGFQDAWEESGNGAGNTCCQDPDLLNNVSNLTSRIDFILFKNGWESIQAETVGDTPNSRSYSGLWPSDHAGVFSKLQLRK